MHLLTDLLEQRPDIDAGEYLQINHYSVITMVHKSAGSALDSFQHVKADGFDEGRLLTVKIRPDKGPILFVSNVYNHVAAEGKQQQALLDQLGARLLHTESLGHVHLAGDDYNASLADYCLRRTTAPLSIVCFRTFVCRCSAKSGGSV